MSTALSMKVLLVLHLYLHLSKYVCLHDNVYNIVNIILTFFYIAPYKTVCLYYCSSMSAPVAERSGKDGGSTACGRTALSSRQTNISASQRGQRASLEQFQGKLGSRVQKA